MNGKVIGGIAAGTLIGGGITYAICKKKMNELDSKHKNDINELNEAIDIVNAEKNDNIIACNDKKVIETTIRDHVISAYRRISDVNMVADISNIKNIEIRDECLSEIEKVIDELSHIINITHENEVTINHLPKVICDIDRKVETMCSNIKDIIKEYELHYEEEDDEDDEDDEESEIQTISPRRVILKCLDGPDKIFEADLDGKFEVLDGSDTENNDYCIIAQNIPELYTFLFTSIKDQLKWHYTSEIDIDAFDSLLEDMIITVSLEFINDDDTMITSVNAVVPFEIFGSSVDNEKCKFYTVKEGELNINDVIRYFRINNGGNDIQSKSINTNESIKTTTIETEKKETQKVVKFSNRPTEIDLSDNTINYIVESICFNRDALKAFVGKLNILLKSNPEAGNTVKSSYIDLVQEIHQLQDNNMLDEITTARISNSLRVLISNMKRNYGSSIKAYAQN